jgi:hypothetical protein
MTGDSIFLAYCFRIEYRSVFWGIPENIPLFFLFFYGITGDVKKYLPLAFLLCTLSLPAQTPGTADFVVQDRVLVKYRGRENEVVIPSSLKIDRIGKQAFAGSPVNTVTIPMGVGFIDERAFAGCSFLRAVSLPNTLVTIGRRAFFNCVSLKEVNLPISLLTIGDGAFFNCRSIEELVFSASLKRIGSRAFSGCIGLRTLSVSRRTALGEHPFMGVRGTITYRD